MENYKKVVSRFFPHVKENLIWDIVIRFALEYEAFGGGHKRRA